MDLMYAGRPTFDFCRTIPRTRRVVAEIGNGSQTARNEEIRVARGVARGRNVSKKYSQITGPLRPSIAICVVGPRATTREFRARTKHATRCKMARNNTNGLIPNKHTSGRVSRGGARLQFA